MRFIIGLLTGILFSAAIFTFYLYPKVKGNWYNQGLTAGRVQAQREIMETISKEFGSVEYQEGYQLLFGVKSSSVYIIDNNGNKTLGTVK